MKNINTVLFDFDGTIMDTNDVIIKSWQYTYKKLLGREEPVENLLKTFGEPLDVTLPKVFPDIPVEESIEVYRGYQRANFQNLIQLFPGMKELLAEVKARGYKTALVTSRLGFTTEQGLKKYGIDECFDVIVTADDTTKHKPDPEPINIALGKLGAVPEEAVMLGDTMFDILCAKNAGVRSVLVSWSMALGGKTIEDMGDDAPDHIIYKPEELFEII